MADVWMLWHLSFPLKRLAKKWQMPDPLLDQRVTDCLLGKV